MANLPFNPDSAKARRRLTYTLGVMSIVLSQAKEKLQAHSLEALSVLLVSVLTTGVLLAENHLAQYVKTIEPTTIVRLLLLSVLVAASCLGVLLYFWPRLKFDSRLGIYRDRKTGLYYCPSCHVKKLRSPLKEGPRGWFCAVKDCRLSYSNPDYVAPPEPPRRRVQSAWESRI